MLKRNLKNKIDEAIASDATTASNRKLLIKIKDDLVKADTEKEYLSIAIEIIVLLGVIVKSVVEGSG